MTESSPPVMGEPFQDLMPTRNLGKTGARVGIFGLGGQGALERANQEELALQMIQRALELGVNYFDTSAIYGGPNRWSERYLGKGLREAGIGSPTISRYLSARPSLGVTLSSRLKNARNSPVPLPH